MSPGKNEDGSDSGTGPAVLEAVLRQDVVGVNPRSFLGTFLYPFSENASRSLNSGLPRRSKNIHDMFVNFFIIVIIYLLFLRERSTLLSPHNTTESPVKPLPRYAHSAARYPGGFVIYGGKLANGSLSDELWLYDVRTRQWSLRCPACSVRPPGLMWHTITLVDGGGRNITYLYLFGGSAESGEFSPKLYRISLVPGKEKPIFTLVYVLIFFIFRKCYV